MRNFVQPGDTITIPAPAATDAGSVVIVGDLKGIACNTATIGMPLDIRRKGVFALPKVAANVFAVGDPVYYTAASKLVGTDNTKPQVGFAAKAAGAGVGTVEVAFG